MPGDGTTAPLLVTDGNGDQWVAKSPFQKQDTDAKRRVCRDWGIGRLATLLNVGPAVALIQDLSGVRLREYWHPLNNRGGRDHIYTAVGSAFANGRTGTLRPVDAVQIAAFLTWTLGQEGEIVFDAGGRPMLVDFGMFVPYLVTATGTAERIRYPKEEGSPGSGFRTALADAAPNDTREAVDRITSISDREIESALSGMPDDWDVQPGQAANLAELLIRRKMILPRLPRLL